MQRTWEARNKVIFSSKESIVDEAFDEIKITSWKCAL